MNTITTYARILLVSISLLTSSHLIAEIEGIWHGKLFAGTDNELAVHFLIKSSGAGRYSATLNSPSSEAISNLVADKVTFNKNKLRIEVSELSGSFEGTLKNDNIDGNWIQLGESIPLSLNPYVDKILTKELVEKVAGRWEGKLKVPGKIFTVVMTFEESVAGKLMGKFESPDQSANSFPMSDITVSEESVSFVIKPLRATYKATFSNSALAGEWSQGRGFSLTMNRAIFDPGKYALKLSDETRALVSGNWYGEIERPGRKTTVALRIIQNEKGLDFGFVDYPDFGSIDMRLKEASRDGDKITLSAGATFEFSGTAVNGQIVGEIKQGGIKFPLKLMNGLLPPLTLSIPKSEHAIFKGKWKGKLILPEGTLTTILTFEQPGDGLMTGFIDSPDQGMKRARITSATYADNKLTVTSKALKLEYTAVKSSESEFEGQVIQRGNTMDLKVTKQN